MMEFFLPGQQKGYENQYWHSQSIAAGKGEIRNKGAWGYYPSYEPKKTGKFSFLFSPQHMRRKPEEFQ